MADIAIRQSAVIPAPDDYTIPGAQELLPKSCAATLDGSAAVSSFFPCLQIVDPGGNVMVSAQSPISVAAGGSATVSWFPGLGNSGSGGVSTFIGARIRASSTQSIPNATDTDLQYQTVDFDTAGMANLGANNRILTVQTPGIYLCICETGWAPNNAGRRLNGIVFNGFVSLGAVYSAAASQMAIWAPIGGGQRTGNTSICYLQMAAGQFISSGCFQQSGAALNCNGGTTGSGGADAYLSAVLVGRT